MSAQDETLRLAAEVVDKFSGPLREMQKALRGIADQNKATNVTHTAQMRDQAKAYAGLDQSVKQIADRTKSMLTPALAAAGVSILSVGGAVAALVKATNSFGETTKKLAFMSRETGLSIAKLRELDALASRIGTSPETMRAGEQAFAHNMEQLRRWRGASAEFFTSQHDLNVRALGNTLRLSTSNEEAFNAVEGFLEKIPDMQQRMNLLKAIGLPEELGRLTGPALRSAFKEIAEDLGKLPAGATAFGLELAHARERLDTALSGTSEMIGAELAGPMAKATDAVREFITANRDGLIKELKEISTSLSGVNWSAFGEGIKGALSLVGDLAKGIERVSKALTYLNQSPEERRKQSSVFIGDQAEQAAGYINNLTGQPSTFKQRGAGIPGFATGGVVPRDMLAMVHKSEIVIPAGGGGLGAGDALKRPIKEGTEAGTRKGVFDGMRDWFEYQKSGAGSPGGSPGGGPGGRMGSTGGPPGGAGVGAPSGHGPGFGAGGEIDIGAGAGLKGGAFLQAQRARMADEVKKDPQLAATLRGLAVAEDAHDPEGVVESLANRAAYTHKSIRSLMYSGFYGPMNRGQVRPNNNPKVQAAIDRVWAGENRLQGATDQGTYADPNARWPGGRIHPPGASRSAIYNDWGGGPGGHEGARLFRESQQRQVMEAAAAHRQPLPNIGMAVGGGLPAPATFNDRFQGDLLQQGRRSGLIGAPAGGELKGNASLDINLTGFPKGTRTASNFGGMFKQLTLNRGVTMPLASEGA
jgi:uncharacterized protein YukE